MSVSSRKLKAMELPDLRLAQEQAALAGDYRQWLYWMRETFTYATVVRMAVYVGHKKPDGSFFNTMKRCGERRLKCMEIAA